MDVYVCVCEGVCVCCFVVSLVSLLFHQYSLQFKFTPRQYVHNTDVYSSPKFLALHFGRTFTISPLFSPSLPPSISPMVFLSRQTHGQCAPDAPLTPSRSLSLLTPLFDTDRWNCYQYWPLSVSASVSHTPLCLCCFPLSYPFPSKKISGERDGMSGKSEQEKRERDGLCSQHVG